MPDFGSFSLGVNLGLFAAAALVVWLAGARLSGYVSAIGDATGIGKAFLGLLLLGGITSLPELATSLTAASRGNADLAVSNVLGGVTMQVAILAIADAILMREALTSIIARPVVLLQGTLDVLLLLLVAAAITVGETGVFGVGLWATLIMVIAMLSLWMVHGYEKRPTWRIRDYRAHDEEGDERPGGDAAAGASETKHQERDPEPEGDDSDEQQEEDRASLRRLIFKTSLAGVAIFLAGFVVARTGESIAGQTGLGASFVGAVLVAISTSLPEVSTVFAAVRQRQYELAVSDIFGTNLFDIALVFVIDAVYGGGYALNEVGEFSIVAALLGAMVTAIFVAGLIERRDRTIWRAGVDSWLVLITYVAGLALLFRLR